MPASALPVQPALGLDPHAPITVEGNDGFAILGAPNLLAGVRQGAGTPQDPFEISNWAIPAPGITTFTGCCSMSSYGLAGLHLNQTSAHALLHRLHVEGTPPNPSIRPVFATAPTPLGVLIEDVSNVTIDFLHVQHFVSGLYILRSNNVTLRHLNVTGVDWTGLLLLDSDVRVEASRFEGVWGDTAVAVGRSKVVVRDSYFSGNNVAFGAGMGSVGDVRYNWWGSAAGPNEPGAEAVLCYSGCAVSPWLTEPPADAGFQSSMVEIPLGAR